MAKKRLKIKDKQGNIVNYDISSASVTIDVEGKTLDVKLTELVAAIQAAVNTVVYNGVPHYVNNSIVDLGNQIQPDWAESSTGYPSFIRNKPDVVTGIKVGDGGETITPTGGIITLPNSGGGQVTDADTEMSGTSENVVQNKVIKAYVDAVSQRIDTLLGSGNVQGAIDTFNEVVAFLNGISSSDTLAAKLLLKQDTIIAGNGIAIAQDGKTVSVDADVVQPVTADGTFAVRIGNDTYTVNLNHTHEGMAKLEKHTPATMPDVEDMEGDTIYAEIEDGEVNMLYIGGAPFYGGGSGTSTPVLRQPADDSTIDVGKIASGESSVSKTITIKGKNLTQALTVAVTGTGYSVDKQSIPAADANVGTTLTITCTSTADDAAGTLSLASSEVSCDCDLVANVPTYEDLRGVKLTGSQWMQTDYKPNANTEFEMRCRFIENSNSQLAESSNAKGFIFSCPNNTGDDKRFVIYQFANDGRTQYNAYGAMLINDTSYNQAGHTQAFLYLPEIGLNYQDFLVDNLKMFYRKGSSEGLFGFNRGGTENTVTTSLKSSTMESPMKIGINIEGVIYCRFDLVIYELKITENGTTVRDWVPKTKNGVPGLYDTVNDTFMSSETSTELVPVTNS